MNLIELSEQLKDVPDQLLLKEVQAPSGAYPSYLVVTELSRRKRMRDQAGKQAPTTTVAQDLAQPSREDMMRAATQQQMAPPQLVSNAPSGIMGMPEASQALAAQDVMGAEPQSMEPQRMAAGGMVAFKQGGDVPRFQNQGFVFPEGSLLGRMQRGEFQGSLLGTTDVANQMLAQQIEEDRRRREQEAAAEAERRRMANRAASMGVDAAFRQVSQNTNTRTGRTDTPPGNAPGGNRLPAAPALTMPAPFQAGPAVTPYDTALAEATAARVGLREPTPEELATERATGISRFQREAPFRLGFLEQDIAKQQQDLAGRRGSNVNEALIQTGLGIMGSKSPRFLQAAGEAGTAGLNAYRQGLKDIRESERNLMQSRVSFANAQSLYDQNKVAAGDRAQQDAMSRYQRAMELANTNSAILARARDAEMDRLRFIQEGKKAEHAAGLDALRTQMAIQKLPGEMALTQAQAAAQTAAAGSSRAYADYLRAGGKKPADRPMGAEDILALRGMAEAALKKRNLPITEENIQQAIASMRSTGAISVGPAAPTSASYSDLMAPR